jgi:hypothetical protein
MPPNSTEVAMPIIKNNYQPKLSLIDLRIVVERLFNPLGFPTGDLSPSSEAGGKKVSWSFTFPDLACSSLYSFANGTFSTRRFISMLERDPRIQSVENLFLSAV